ncbi:MAG: HDOD domain-containing protein [Geopsychrobacter sp.]|nr:HDOD domain-containing protein [Geopsychrobacter sp.]
MATDFQTVVRSIGDLPPMPAVATKVLRMLQSPETNFSQLGEAISSDPAVSARLLKVANSAFFSLKRQVKTLDHAIAIVGERTLRSLVLAASLEGMNKSYGLLEKLLWEDSIGCAIGARFLARRFNTADPEEAFLAGLFRHLGKIIMNYSDPEGYRALAVAVYGGEGSFNDIEGRFFPYAHAVVGAAVLNKWNFSDDLIQCTLHHEDLAIEREGNEVQFRLAATVALADIICARIGIGAGEPDESLIVEDSKAVEALALDKGQVDDSIEEIEEIFNENRDSFLS